MAIPQGYKDNFHTMLRAAKNGHLALLECTDKITSKLVYTVVALHPEKNAEGNTEIVMSPFAKLFDGDPYSELSPPAPEDKPALTIVK